MRSSIVFYLNGRKIEAKAEHASMMLADYLRYQLNLTGTKIVCAEGDCGACSVLRYFPHHSNHTDKYLPINSCIAMVAQLDGSSLVTVDAIKKNEVLHETQKAMIVCHGSQCGFCTPGFVMALTGLVEKKLATNATTINAAEAKNCLTGNLCRCTGYQSIIDAATSIDLNKCESILQRFYSPEQEKELKEVYQQPVTLSSEHFSFFAPKNLQDATNFLKENPSTKIIASATDLAVQHNKRKIKLNKLLSLHLIDELYEVKLNNKLISIGAKVTLSEFRNFIIDKLPEFASYLDVFASPQIKNTATLIGNIANASPIADTPVALLALKAVVCVQGSKGKREIALSQFFIAYKKTNLAADEIITGIYFELPEKNVLLRFLKSSNRKDLDISSVNFAIKVDWQDQQKTNINEIIIALGGVAATPIRLLKTETFLKNNLLNKANLEIAIKEMHQEIIPISDHRASAAYRRLVVENFMRNTFEQAGVLP